MCDLSVSLHFLSSVLYAKTFSSWFRANHSTETALAKVTNHLLKASDKGLVSVQVLIDLSAALDTIDYQMEQLIGIIGTALRWFQSYLSN